MLISGSLPARAEPLCGVSSGTLLIQVDSRKALIALSVDSGNIVVESEFGVMSCVDESGTPANVLNTDLIWVYGQAEFLVVVVNLGGGPFAPGLTPEEEGSSEIEIRVDWPRPSKNQRLEHSVVVVLGSSGADDIATGKKINESVAINLNAGESQDDLDLTAGTPSTSLGFGRMVVAGRGGSDRLTGSRAAIQFERFLGGPGNDLIRGGAGIDLVEGQGGSDLLYGDADRDFVRGGPGNDHCLGGPGADQVKACESGSG